MTKQVEFKAVYRVSRTWEYSERAWSEYDESFYYDRRIDSDDRDFDTLEEAEAFFERQVKLYPNYDIDIVQMWEPVDENAIKGTNLKYHEGK